MNVKITFEISKGAPMLNGETNDLESSLHEALCLAIHENDEIALSWLSENVLDINLE